MCLDNRQGDRRNYIGEVIGEYSSKEDPVCNFFIFCKTHQTFTFYVIFFRTEPKSQAHLGISGANSNSRPITPVEMKKSPTHGRATGRTKVTSGRRREPIAQLHPKQCSPLRVSPYGKSPPFTSTNRYKHFFNINESN